MSCYMIYELIIDTLFLIISLGTFIWTLVDLNFKEIFVDLEHILLWLESLYYLLLSLVGYFSLCNDAKSKSFQRFWKSYIFKFIWPFSLMSTGFFYLGYCLKWFDENFEIFNKELLLSLLIHGGVQIPMVIDAILFRREYKPSYALDFIIFTCIYVGYCLLNFFFINDPLYLYRTEDFKFKVGVYSFGYIVLIFTYGIYQSIIKMRFGLKERISRLSSVVSKNDEEANINEKINDVDNIEPVSTEMKSINNVDDSNINNDRGNESD